jgi:hypothetical protein
MCNYKMPVKHKLRILHGRKMISIISINKKRIFNLLFSRSNTYTHTHTRTPSLSHTHSFSLSLSLSNTHTRTHIRIYTHKHTYSLSQTHTHTHPPTQSQNSSLPFHSFNKLILLLLSVNERVIVNCCECFCLFSKLKFLLSLSLKSLMQPNRKFSSFY